MRFDYFLLNNMTQRKGWTSFQDQILKQLRQIRKISKWTVIAALMNNQFQIQGRTGKQCRERYHNHLDSKIIKKEWTKQQDELIYELHNKYGNKWAIIAQNLNGRTDNYVKNHFYSKLRRALRKMNKFIQENQKKNFKEFKIIDLYKIIQASEDKFKQTQEIDFQIDKISNLAFGQSFDNLELKNKLFMFADDENDVSNQYLVQLIKKTNQFCKQYKRKPKKSRRYSPMCADSVYRVSHRKLNGVVNLTSQISLQNQLHSSKHIQSIQRLQNKVQIQNLQKTAKLTQEIQIDKIQSKFSFNQYTKQHFSRSLQGKLQKFGLLLEQNTELQIKPRKKSGSISFSDIDEEHKEQLNQIIENNNNMNQFQNMVMTFKSQVNFNSFSYSVVEEFQFQ